MKRQEPASSGGSDHKVPHSQYGFKRQVARVFVAGETLLVWHSAATGRATWSGFECMAKGTHSTMTIAALQKELLSFLWVLCSERRLQMQLIDTKVGHDGTTLTVDFIGEGGEMVSVRMEDEAGRFSDEAAIDHARVMMVQLAAFGGADDRSPINDYDAFSNGNFDRAEPEILPVTDVVLSERTTH